MNDCSRIKNPFAVSVTPFHEHWVAVGAQLVLTPTDARRLAYRLIKVSKTVTEKECVSWQSGLPIFRIDTLDDDDEDEEGSK